MLVSGVALLLMSLWPRYVQFYENGIRISDLEHFRPRFVAWSEVRNWNWYGPALNLGIGAGQSVAIPLRAADREHVESVLAAHVSPR